MSVICNGRQRFDHCLLKVLLLAQLLLGLQALLYSINLCDYLLQTLFMLM